MDNAPERGTTSLVTAEMKIKARYRLPPIRASVPRSNRCRHRGWEHHMGRPMRNMISCEFLKSQKHTFTMRPMNSSLRSLSKRGEACGHVRLCTQTFPTALSTTATKCKLHKCPLSGDGQTKCSTSTQRNPLQQ